MKPDWLRRDAELCWHPYTQHGLESEPLAVSGARGAWLELADGRRILDGISSWWTCLHGHGHPELVAALAAQARVLDHVLFAGCTHEPAVRLADALVKHAGRLARHGGDALNRVFYSDDGSTAVEVALKAAYQCWVRRGEPSRTGILALQGGYHGDTFGAMSAGDPNPFFAEFQPFLFHVGRVRPEPEHLRDALEQQAGRVAALIVEPLVQGANGMTPVPADFLREARRLCDEHGVFLIADEVMTGFGRTGSLFACEQAQLNPDLLCLAKGLTGGMLPLAATLVRGEIYESFLSDKRAEAFFHGHSFTANPLGCAVGLASLSVLEQEDTPARFREIGRWLEADLAELRGAGGVRELRRVGGIAAVELEVGDAGYLASVGEELRRRCRAAPDALLRPLGNVLYAMPPACTSREECHTLAENMLEVLAPFRATSHAPS